MFLTVDANIMSINYQCLVKDPQIQVSDFFIVLSPEYKAIACYITRRIKAL